MKHHLKLWVRCCWAPHGGTCLSCAVARSCHSSFCPTAVARKATPFLKEWNPWERPFLNSISLHCEYDSVETFCFLILSVIKTKYRFGSGGISCWGCYLKWTNQSEYLYKIVLNILGNVQLILNFLEGFLQSIWTSCITCASVWQCKQVLIEVLR